MKTIAAIIGTRPEAIKMLPVVRALRGHAGINPLVVVTGQHRHMLDQMFEAFGERPDVDLDLMAPGQTLAEINVRVLQKMATVIAEHCPSLVIVQGDTTTAMAAALAAFYAKVPVAHVEAGLRSHDLGKPWPEEFNRITIDAMADLLFPPTAMAADHLRRESPRDRPILVTGNTGIDALLYTADRLSGAELGSLDLNLDPARRMVLVTGHRRESFGEGFARICDALTKIAARGDVDLVYPVHLNPEVQGIVRERLAGLSNVHLIEPVGYLQMVALMKHAFVILTDSGGIQEEGPALGKPVLVMRDVTERPEAVDTGVASLVGTDPDLICGELFRLLDDPAYHASRARPVFPYGDGTASIKIAAAIADYLKV
jgi:UDP-N-acetylglucosamine 2-epimerase (non-hydrolysing)